MRKINFLLFLPFLSVISIHFHFILRWVCSQEYGHRVRLATHENFRDFVQSGGLEFFPLGGDSKVLADCTSLPVTKSACTCFHYLSISLFHCCEGFMSILQKPSSSSNTFFAWMHVVQLFATCSLPVMVKNRGFVTMKGYKARKQIKSVVYSLLEPCTEPAEGSDEPFNAQVIIANPITYGTLQFLCVNPVVGVSYLVVSLTSEKPYQISDSSFNLCMVLCRTCGCCRVSEGAFTHLFYNAMDVWPLNFCFEIFLVCLVWNL